MTGLNYQWRLRHSGVIVKELNTVRLIKFCFI